MKYITFDTSWLEKINYDFSFSAFRCIQYTDYQVILSEIIDDEIKKHLKIKAQEFVSAYNGSLKKVQFLTNLHRLPKLIKEDDIVKAAQDSYEMFKNTVRAIIIPLEKCNFKEIFKQYFAEEGPFADAGKKHEFPDAAAIDGIIRYINGNEIIVFSSDGDWKNGFQNYIKSKVFTERSDLLEIVKTEDLAGEVIDDYIENHRDEFEQHLYNSFEKYFSNESILFPEDSTIGYLDINDFDINFIEYAAIDVVSKNDADKTILVAIHFKYDFLLKISFDDYSCSSYDSEDDITYNIIRRRQNISGTETGYCFVEFKFKSDKFEKIIECKLEDVDFCYKESHKYSIEDEPIEEDDYYDSKI